MGGRSPGLVLVLSPAFLAAALLLGAATPVAKATASATPAPALVSPEAWARVVATHADRDAVVSALGIPPVSFPAVIDPARPMLVVPTTIEPPVEGGPARAAVRVYQWPSDVEGLPWQVVMRDGKVLWAVGPPSADERDVAAVMKKYGAAAPSTESVLKADMLAEWEVLSYPAKGVTFVFKPGAKEIAGRRLTAPPALIP